MKVETLHSHATSQGQVAMVHAAYKSDAVSPHRITSFIYLGI